MAGHVIYRWLKEQGHQVITHVYRTPLNEDSVVLDVFQNAKRLDRLIESRDPDIIINCIGVLPAECECHPDRAAYLNTFLPHHLSTKGRVIHISTDCVFSGKRGSYTEAAVKDAQTIYGLTKSAGELNNDKDLTIRTSIVGPELKKNGTGLFSWFQSQSDNIDGWANAYWNGVTTLELAQFIEKMMEDEATGLCHLHAEEPVSKFQLLKLFRQVWSGPNVGITPHVLQQNVDKTLVSTRDDIDWMPTTIGSQLYALLAWYDKKVPEGS